MANRTSTTSNISVNGEGHPDIPVLDTTLFAPLPAPSAPPEAGPDPFDPARLRLDLDLSADLGVQKALLTVPVCKPSPTWWVRCHPDPAFRLSIGVIELKEEREVFAVDPALWPYLAGESAASPRLIVTAITRQGVVFLWPLRPPDSSGRGNTWLQSAWEAAEMARKTWIRLQANMTLRGYDVSFSAAFADPQWPPQSLQALLGIAFKDKYISSPDHPVLRQLRGEV
jgi:hypothetical protein